VGFLFRALLSRGETTSQQPLKKGIAQGCSDSCRSAAHTHDEAVNLLMVRKAKISQHHKMFFWKLLLPFTPMNYMPLGWSENVLKIVNVNQFYFNSLKLFYL